LAEHLDEAFVNVIAEVLAALEIFEEASARLLGDHRRDVGRVHQPHRQRILQIVNPERDVVG
jgi:hypothetical protein